MQIDINHNDAPRDVTMDARTTGVLRFVRFGSLARCRMATTEGTATKWPGRMTFSLSIKHGERVVSTGEHCVACYSAPRLGMAGR